MVKSKYFSEMGGHPDQTNLLTDRAVFTDAYAVIPRGSMRDIVTSFLPFWDETRLWVISRPLSGFSETFSQYIMEVQPGGGSNQPETDTDAEGVLFVVDGSIAISFNGKKYDLTEGGYAYLPAGLIWKLRNETDKAAKFHWIRKSYQYVDGLDKPEPIVTNAKDIEPTPMPDTDGNWTTTRFVNPADIRHDMHVTIVTLQPGAVIPFCETHVMEHGLYVLNGKAVYRLNQDWVEVSR